MVGTLAALALVLGGGCRQDMHNQAKYEPLEASPLFGDGAASRPLVEGTVARGQLREDDAFYRGLTAGGEFVTELPLDWSAGLLARGRSRFEAFCSPCHDRAGSGRGMIVRRGYKQPNSFHSQRLRDAAVGYYFSVMTNGFGQMSSYAPQLTPADRWAVAAYIRALQLSQAAPLDRLNAIDLERLAASPEQAAEPGPEPAAEGGHGG